MTRLQVPNLPHYKKTNTDIQTFNVRIENPSILTARKATIAATDNIIMIVVGEKVSESRITERLGWQQSVTSS